MTQQQIMVKSALDAWNTHINRTWNLFTELSDEQLEQPTASGRNSGYYLLGHLVAVHDGLLPLFGIGNKLYPELEEPFIQQSEATGSDKPPVKELREHWQQVHTKLSKEFNQFTVEQWLQKHTAVKEEDFAKEPHRNRLNVLLNRTNHLAYHLGQLVYLKK